MYPITRNGNLFMELATHNEDKTDNLIIYYQNTRSLHNQKDELTTIFSKLESKVPI